MPLETTSSATWSREALEAVQPYATEGRYVNDVAETSTEVTRAIYGRRSTSVSGS